jgi:hypothetical protein
MRAGGVVQASKRKRSMSTFLCNFSEVAFEAAATLFGRETKGSFFGLGELEGPNARRCWQRRSLPLELPLLGDQRFLELSVLPPTLTGGRTRGARLST